MTQSQSLDRNVQRSALRRRSDPSAESTPKHDRPTHPLLTLQSQVGNATIARMFAQREGEEEEALQAKHDSAIAQREGAEEEELQTKHDPAIAQRQPQEEEEPVQAKHDSAVAQREGAEEEELQAKHDSAIAQRQPQEEDEMVQAKHVTSLAQREPEVGMEGGPISDQLAGRIHSRRGGGTALDEGTRSGMEGAFGASFNDVRLHTDGEADTLNRSLSAKAFTTGSDIFFQSGAYQPSSSEGRKLLSHELTHVVQQRSMSSSGPMRVSPAGDAHEQQADAMADSIASRMVQRETDQGMAARIARHQAGPTEDSAH